VVPFDHGRRVVDRVDRDATVSASCRGPPVPVLPPSLVVIDSVSLPLKFASGIAQSAERGIYVVQRAMEREAGGAVVCRVERDADRSNPSVSVP
jgi:hypothetical protein